MRARTRAEDATGEGECPDARRKELPARRALCTLAHQFRGWQQTSGDTPEGDIMAEYGKAVWSHPGRDYKKGKDAVGPMMRQVPSCSR